MKKLYKVYGGPRLRSFALLEWAKPYAEQIYRRKDNTYAYGSPVEVWKWDEQIRKFVAVAVFDAQGWRDQT